MSDQAKTILAYILGLSVLLLAWSFFKAWEPSLPLIGSDAIVAPQPSGGRPSVPVARQ